MIMTPLMTLAKSLYLNASTPIILIHLPALINYLASYLMKTSTFPSTLAASKQSSQRPFSV